MYNTHIQTTLGIRGHVVFIEYMVTEEWALSWWLNLGAYEDCIPNDEAVRLLETLLRTFEEERIEHQLMSEFESRKYAEEQKFIANDEDIPF